jgi:hypothetical protein
MRGPMEDDQTRLPDTELQLKADSFDQQYIHSQRLAGTTDPDTADSGEN